MPQPCGGLVGSLAVRGDGGWEGPLARGVLIVRSTRRCNRKLSGPASASSRGASRYGPCRAQATSSGTPLELFAQIRNPGTKNQCQLCTQLPPGRSICSGDGAGGHNAGAGGIRPGGCSAVFGPGDHAGSRALSSPQAVHSRRRSPRPCGCARRRPLQVVTAAAAKLAWQGYAYSLMFERGGAWAGYAPGLRRGWLGGRSMVGAAARRPLRRCCSCLTRYQSQCPRYPAAACITRKLTRCSQAAAARLVGHPVARVPRRAYTSIATMTNLLLLT